MRGHVRQRGKKWAYVIDVGEGENGKRKQQWRSGFPTKKAAQAELTRELHARSEGTFIEPHKLTVATYLNDHWRPAIRATVRPSTLSSYEMHVRKYLVPQLGAIRLQKLTGASLSAMYGQLADTGLSAATIRRVHATAHKALRDAVRWQLVVRNVADQANPPRASRPEMKVWTAAELAAFLAFAKGSDDLHDVYYLIATTGLRRGEALGVRWRDIDLDAGRLSVTRALVPVDHALIFSEPKTKKGRRSISLDPTTVAMLREHRRRQLEERLKAGPAYQDGDLVFAHADGTPLHPELVSRRFVRTTAKAELPLIRVHDLRHTWATLALTAGVNPKVVSEQLGHSNVGVTLDTYSHVTIGLQEDAASRVASLIFGA